MEIIRVNRDTRFGKMHRFNEIRKVSDYVGAVPISTYEDYIPSIDLIAMGKTKVLTEEPVLSLKPTSGSTRATKLIPYAEGLRKDFKKGILPWIFDLFVSFRSLFLCSSYWSITPALGTRMVSSGPVPVGFADDSEYFGAIERRLINVLLAVPKEICEIKDLANFHYMTLLFLVKDRYLGLISVWNPTFLTNMLRNLPVWLPVIIRDIRLGVITLPSPSEDGVVGKRLVKRLAPDPVRADQILHALPLNASLPEMCGTIWPRLTVVSCWGDGASGWYLEELRHILPPVRIQKKGLIATEGIVSFPMEKWGCMLSVRSHFFEFIEWGSDGKMKRCLLAHEVEIGRTYVVVLTTNGGLYRYRTGDLIVVEGFLAQCPIVRFVGRADKISDLFGEKLNEDHVSSILNDEFGTTGVHPAFFLMAPEVFSGGGTRYVLYLEPSPQVALDALQSLERRIEMKLQENYHYAYCRKLGQLQRLRIFIIEERGTDSHLKTCYASGLRLGDIKPSVLDKRTGWSNHFRGGFISEREPGSGIIQ